MLCRSGGGNLNLEKNEKECIVKKSFPSCAQQGLALIEDGYVEAYTNNAIPNCDRKNR